MQDEQNVPIDIHTNKLLDWLVSRRHCKHDWQNEVKTIREKINNAIQDMPAVDEICELLAGAYINYFHCLRIVELLKDTESASKNIFGRYSSQRMKDWQEILRLYEKDNVYLAEAAQMLIRNVKYEIPSFKKQISKCQQVQEECDKKENDYSRSAKELKDKYHTDCRKLGIEGVKVQTEILSLLSDLPKMYDEIATNIHLLGESQRYYETFKGFILGKEVTEVLPLLSFLMERGNVTTYEWKIGEKPTVVREPQLQPTVENDPDDNAETDTIDFGDDDNGNANEISWDITVDDNVETSGDVKGVAEGEYALSVLDNVNTRNEVIDELSELEAFIKQRILEMQSDSDILSSNRFQTAPPGLMLVTRESLLAMLAIVQTMINSLTNVKMLSLQLIRTSPRYVDRISKSLKQNLLAADKMLLSKEAVVNRCKEAVEEGKQLEPRLRLIIRRTTELQAQIETDISKRYKNRPVNLMGGVNTL